MRLRRVRQNCLFLKLICVAGLFTSSSATQIFIKVKLGLRMRPKQIVSGLYKRESGVRKS